MFLTTRCRSWPRISIPRRSAPSTMRNPNTRSRTRCGAMTVTSSSRSHDGSIHYHLYEDADDGQVTIIGEGILTENGHMTYSPVDKRWLLTDTYPDPVTNERVLILFDRGQQRPPRCRQLLCRPGTDQG